MDVGRVNKTLYLLNYIDDEDYRRRILTQTNRGEGRHAVVLWNTLYMLEALDWIRSNNEEIIEDDISRPSPLIYKNINILSHYTFTLPEDLVKGELRPLNLNNSDKY
ncbi:transposase [Vibrio owensii CAIM 1854 = LMG 25443]|uniref:Transposase n=1 Tax=Vibrio owensii CAIM 1854 = LMG 25443 TaxID=1229493 RepID=A0A0C1Z5Y5_9VIBR|nr:transposase [Vibrio owensii CAIM 1854 = LMG 25443]